jgi:hypothetical protein
LDIHYGELLGYALFIFAHGGAGLMKTSESELVGDKLSRGRIVEVLLCRVQSQNISLLTRFEAGRKSLWMTKKRYEHI